MHWATTGYYDTCVLRTNEKTAIFKSIKNATKGYDTCVLRTNKKTTIIKSIKNNFQSLLKFVYAVN